MNRFSLKTRLRLALAAVCLSVVAIAVWGAINTRQTMLSGRQAELRSVVSLAYTTVQRYESLATSGKISVEEAQKQARESLRAMRYAGAGGYIFIEDPHGRVIMHGVRPELDGRDMSTFKDTSGYYSFRDGAALAARQGEAFIRLLYMKPGSAEMVPKINFLKLFPQWNWIIATGLFVDDIDEALYAALLKYLSAATIMCAAVALIFRLVARSIFRQMGGEPVYAAEIANQIASGNINLSIKTRDNDDSSVLASMKVMQQQLLEAIVQIRDGAATIASVSGEIASGTADLSHRTEEQAASLSETASSMEQLTATVRQNADNAHQARRLANSASETATRGGQVVNKVVATMQGISESSHRIGDIIGVIEGIAFQTNILALNAAVEAARAGEQGRGFAVVAAEVRTLAQRSAGAAKEIRTLIQDSASQIEGGKEHVTLAGSTMMEIVEAVNQVTHVVGEITIASSEQTTGIEQVNIAVSSMDQTTQKNAALVEEASASAELLRQQSVSLKEAISVFRLDAAA